MIDVDERIIRYVFLLRESAVLDAERREL